MRSPTIPLRAICPKLLQLLDCKLAVPKEAERNYNPRRCFVLLSLVPAGQGLYTSGFAERLGRVIMRVPLFVESHSHAYPSRWVEKHACVQTDLHLAVGVYDVMFSRGLCRSVLGATASFSHRHSSFLCSKVGFEWISIFSQGLSTGLWMY